MTRSACQNLLVPVRSAALHQPLVGLDNSSVKEPVIPQASCHDSIHFSKHETTPTFPSLSRLTGGHSARGEVRQLEQQQQQRP
jgi:hypothetical protein